MFYLAQMNIAQAKDSMESDVMREFVERLDEINALADVAPGFVWRLQTEQGDATSIQAFDDPMLLVNMSVWEDLESLQNFVYRSMHVDLIRQGGAWFNKKSRAHQVLWWIPAGHVPDVSEGKKCLALLQKLGPSCEAFTFAKPFPAPAK